MDSRTQSLPQPLPRTAVRRASRVRAARKPGDGYLGGVAVALLAMVALASVWLMHGAPTGRMAARATLPLAATASPEQCVAPHDFGLVPLIWPQGDGCDDHQAAQMAAANPDPAQAPCLAAAEVAADLPNTPLPTAATRRSTSTLPPRVTP